MVRRFHVFGISAGERPRVSASAFFGHKFRRPPQTFLIFCRRVNMKFMHDISKQEARLDKLRSYFYMVEYCEIFKMAIFENSRFSAWAQNSVLTRVVHGF